MIQFLKSFLRDEEGVAAIEYGLITSLIALAMVGSVSDVGTRLSGTFTKLARAIGGLPV